MAISVQDFQLAWRRVGNYLNQFKPSTQLLLTQLKSYQAQFKAVGGNLDLQVVPFDHLSDSEVVLADAACKLYAVVFKKTTSTATYSKLTDNATTSSDAGSEIRVKQAEIDEFVGVWPEGLPFANGITAQGNTTATGGTGSAADGAVGFVIIGRP